MSPELLQTDNPEMRLRLLNYTASRTQWNEMNQEEIAEATLREIKVQVMPQREKKGNLIINNLRLPLLAGKMLLDLNRTNPELRQELS